MAHVPDDAVLRRVVDVVQGHGQLHRAQVGTEVAARLGHALQQELAQFSGQLSQLGARHLAQISRIVDGMQQGITEFRHMLFLVAARACFTGLTVVLLNQLAGAVHHHARQRPQCIGAKRTGAVCLRRSSAPSACASKVRA